MEWIDIIARYVVPPILGGLGAFAGVWANWGIEQRRLRFNRRLGLVRIWRRTLLPILLDGDKDLFLQHSAYATLRPHLLQKIISTLEDPGLIIVPNSMVGTYRKLIIEEIARIERKWKLV